MVVPFAERDSGMKRILIVGCGDLGSGLGLELAQEGHEVWGLRRNPDRIPEPIRPLAGDFSEPGGLPPFPDKLDGVYLIATPGEYSDAGYARAYVQGMRHVLAQLAAEGQDPERVVFVSSTGVYGEDMGGWVDEDTDPRPQRFSGHRLLEAEQLLSVAPFPGVSVRFAGIYGPGRTRLVEKVRSGGAAVDNPPRYTNRIHRDDCVGILAHLFRMADPAPVYVGVDDAPCPQTEVMDWIADRLHVPRPPRESNTGGRNKRCSNRRLRESGYQLRYPSYREGFDALLADG